MMMPQDPGAVPALAPPNPGAEPTQAPAPTFHDVKIRRKKKVERAIVVPVPPEEFGISRYARSVKDSGYTFHKVIKRQHELIAEGFDPEQVENLSAYTGVDNFEETARDTVEERMGGMGDSGLNTANREIEIVEHYIILDYEGDGKPCMYRITTGGSPSQIMRRKQDDGSFIEDIVKWDTQPPFACGCPVPIPHRFFGRSIADLVMDIQRIKTALIRGNLDNLYQRVNPQTEVAESHASVNTLDDLLIRRPGGVVRTKVPGGINQLETADVSQSVFPALQYFDAQREWRTGVQRQGQGVDPNALQNQVATIANQMEVASQAKVKMIARILAETGIKDLFQLLHATIRRHGSIKQTVRLRNKWTTVDPRDWKARSDMSINVGLGTGSRASQIAELQMLVGYQEKGIQAGLVTKGQLYNSARELVRIIKPGADPGAFFSDPVAPPNPDDPPLQPPQDPKANSAQQQVQIAQQKAQADVQIAAQKSQADQQMNTAKITAEAQLKHAQAVADAQLRREQMIEEAAMKREQMAAEFALKREEMMAEMQLRREQMIVDANVKRELGLAGLSKDADKSVSVGNVEMGGEVG